MTRRRGRPPKVERDVAVLLAFEWHLRAEGLTRNKAALAVTLMWQALDRKGLGRPGADSKAVYRSLRAAQRVLGEGRFMVLPGIEAGGHLLDAAAFFIPAGSDLSNARRGAGQTVRGACWRWSFPEETAELLSEQRRSQVVGTVACPTPGRDPRAGAGHQKPVPEPRFAMSAPIS